MFIVTSGPLCHMVTMFFLRQKTEPQEHSVLLSLEYDLYAHVIIKDGTDSKRINLDQVLWVLLAASNVYSDHSLN
jgi:hypothetical protein